jgi:hypothetical protein
VSWGRAYLDAGAAAQLGAVRAHHGLLDLAETYKAFEYFFDVLLFVGRAYVGLFDFFVATEGGVQKGGVLVDAVHR